MFKYKLSVVIIVTMLFGCFAESCQAGPLLDWLRGVRSNNVYRYNAFRPNAFAPGGQMPGGQVPTGYTGVQPNQLPGTCTSICPTTRYQTVNRVVANYVPFTAYRTEWYRVPTTYYRPETSTNPQTGCITTCMKPCTTYQMQARRVPYTTYQTVYRTVSQRIPYTVYETSYSTSGSCGSCGTGVPAPNPVPTQYYGGAPNQANYGLNPNVNYSPANSVPQLNPGDIRPDPEFQRRIVYPPQPEPDPAATESGVDAINSSNSTPINVNPPAINMPANPAPVVDQGAGNQTASLIRGKWDYSPVRHARYLSSVSDNSFSNASSTHQQTPSRANQSTQKRVHHSTSSGPFRSPSTRSSWKSTGN